MRRHPRVRVLGAGVLLAVIGVVLGAASPAAAAKPSIDITGLPGEFKAGEPAKTITFSVTNNTGAGDGTPKVKIRVFTSIGEITCVENCNIDDDVLPPGTTKSYTAKLKAGNVEPGQSRAGKVTIVARAGEDQQSVSADITARGSDATPTVKEVNGVVKGDDGKPVLGAIVGLRDSTGRTFNPVTTQANGRFRFVGTPDLPIAPGRLEIAARKENVIGQTVTVNGVAGKSNTVTVSLAGITTVPSASASASASPSAETSAEAATDASPQVSPAASVNATPTSDESSSSSMIFIIAGILLVAVGIGVIILIFVRRKENDKKLDEEEAAAVPAAAAASHYGAPDPTRVANRPVSGRPADATMVAGAGRATSLSEAPTMLHQAVPVEDEFPDPYGVPRPAPGGYAQASTQNWEQPPAYGRYDEGTQYAAPRPAEPRYDEPTGMYQPPADNGGYEPTGGFRTGGAYQSAGGYDEPDAGYPSAGQARPAGTYGGSAASGAGTYGASASGGLDTGGAYGTSAGGGAYGAPAGGGSAYGSTAAGGAYGSPGGGQEATYGRPAPRGGYEEPAAYPEQQGGGRRAAEPGRGGQYGGGDERGGQRRSLDWLDD